MAFRRPPARQAVEDETIVQQRVSPAAQRVQEEYVTDVAPPPPPRHNDIWGWLAAALFAILALVAGFYALTRPHVRTVPTVVGLPVATAKATLEQKGFRVDTISVPRQGGGGGVLRQEPNPGAKLEKGAHVGIVFAQAATVKLPKLVGLKVESATRLLTSLNLKAEPTVVASDQPKGTILSQQQTEGTKLSAGASVPFTVAKGPDLVKVPALQGLSVAKATAQLQGLGLTPVVHEVASAQPPNTVVAQSPAANGKVKAGSKVNVNVSKGAGDVTVPDATGLDQSTAVSTLQALGLKVDLVTIAGAAAQGTVVRQDPPANGSIAKGAKVRLFTSDGSRSSTDTSTSLGDTTTTP
jgi:serine/threonine-protein kinase